MKTRTKVSQDENLRRDQFTRMVEEDAGAGVSTKFVDRAYWLDSDPVNQPWYEALWTLDRRGDKEPLLTLLRSDAPLRVEVRSYLADLLSRYQLKHRRGGKQVPAYDCSDVATKLALAVSDARSMRRRGVPRADAIRRAASTHRIDEREVESAYEGRLGVLRRSPARRLP